MNELPEETCTHTHNMAMIWIRTRDNAQHYHSLKSKRQGHDNMTLKYMVTIRDRLLHTYIDMVMYSKV